jgi:hypothetical protein
LKILWICLWIALTASAADSAPAARVEVRSSDLLAVGLVRGDTMSVRVSKLLDNAPVNDAAVTLVLRGTAHAATAETDGSYSVRTPDLALSGAAAVDIQVRRGPAVENLKGTLDVTGAEGGSDDKNSNRQVWWWVLNFAVCGAALWLFSRRRKAAKT